MAVICEDWRLFILKCRNELSSDISYDLVAPSLIEHGIISADEHSELSVNSQNESKVKSLINLLASMKGEAVYFRFLDYLEADYDWLALQIKECTLTIEEREKYTTLLNNNKSHLNKNGNFRSLRSNTTVINNEVKYSNTSDKCSKEEIIRKEVTNENVLLKSYDKTGCSTQNLNKSTSSCSPLNFDLSSSNLTCSTPSHSSQSPAHTPPRSVASSQPKTVVNNPTGSILSSNGLDLNMVPLHATGSSPNPPASTPCSSLGSLHSTNGSSPLHSSNFSIFSSTGSEHSAGHQTTTSSLHQEQQLGVKRGYQDSDDINEEILEYISSNPLIMKKWQSLAHQTGLTSRVPVIQARIRGEGRDFDEHVTEFFREWMERKPGEATIGGLISLLRKLRFNETAMRIEDGSYKKKLKSF